MVSVSFPPKLIPAGSIPYPTADEVFSLLETQLDRFLALLETLDEADWSRPTACTLWNVRDILAHQAGGYASGLGYREMIRQYARIPKRGQLPEDATNELQLRERSGHSPLEMIAELRRVGPPAIRNWAYRFRAAKKIIFSHPVAGLMSLQYLMWVIHSRDTWMHRLDICRATGKPFEQTPDQDGRIVALILRDVEKTLRKELTGKALVFDLSGVAGGAWQIGTGAPAAVLQMDALDFCIFASGRFTLSEAMARAAITGDAELINTTLGKLLILF
jgi:uncharacterized protein (TIGR03083 family)